MTAKSSRSVPFQSQITCRTPITEDYEARAGAGLGCGSRSGTHGGGRAMRLKAWHVPVRLATGAFILNSGLTKERSDTEQAAQLHGFATTAAFPQLADLDPET